MPLAQIFLSIKNRSGDEVAIVHNKPESRSFAKGKGELLK
jgi:hypothetical protein